MIITDLLNAHCCDKVTGFTGICTVVVFYSTGCHQALLVPRVDKDGDTQEAHWFDVQRVEVLQARAVTIDNGNTPGCDAPAPGRDSRMTAPHLQDLVLFVDDPETGDEAGLVAGLARVATVGGPVMVPGTRHLDVPHLAVTSRTMGTFDVTHLPTGMTLVRGCDTLGAALLVLAQLHAIVSKYRLDLTSRDDAALRQAFAEIDAFPVPFACATPASRPSVGDWLRDSRTQIAAWELPWETPAALVREALEMIAMVGIIVPTPPTAPAPVAP